MMRNICGNDTSHLRSETGSGRRIPTLRIGLISNVPVARSHLKWRKFVLLFILLTVLTACTSRVVYDTASTKMPFTAGPININTATADEFEKLPHIGRKTAEAIVEFREQNGPFRRPENLMQIRGISEKRFLELREFLKTE